MVSDGGVVDFMRWIMLGIERVTSATWYTCFGDDDTLT